MTATLSQRLRAMYNEMRRHSDTIPGWDTNLFFEAIAQAEAQEAQAIGEQTPVAQANPIIGNVHERWHELGYGNTDRLHERFRGDPWRIFYAGWIEGRAPLVAQLKDNHRLFTEARDALAEYRDKHRSPISPEARDRAIEAGNAMRVQLLALALDYRDAMLAKGGTELDLHPAHYDALDAWDQALSALRGE